MRYNYKKSKDCNGFIFYLIIVIKISIDLVIKLSVWGKDNPQRIKLNTHSPNILLFSSVYMFNINSSKFKPPIDTCVSLDSILHHI